MWMRAMMRAIIPHMSTIAQSEMLDAASGDRNALKFSS